MTCNSLNYHTDHMCWQQRVDKELFSQRRYQNALKQNALAPGMRNGYMPLRKFEKLNADQNALKKTNFYMLNSSYLVASDPNSMRDFGPARNAQYYIPMQNCMTEQAQNQQDNNTFEYDLEDDQLKTHRDQIQQQQLQSRLYRTQQNFNARDASPIIYGKTGSNLNRSESPFMKTSMSYYSPPSASSMKKKPTKNQLMYTFGSRTNIKESPGWASSSSQNPLFQPKMVGGQRVQDVNNPITGNQFYNSNIIQQSSPVMMMSMPEIKQYQNYINGNEQEELEEQQRIRARQEPVQIIKDPNVDRRDYTKNLSQHLFFPGMTNEQFRTSAEKVSAKSQRMFQERDKLIKTRQLKELYGGGSGIQRKIGSRQGTKQFKPQRIMAHQDFRSDVISIVSGRSLNNKNGNVRRSLLPEFRKHNNVLNINNDEQKSTIAEKSGAFNNFKADMAHRRINSQNV